MSGPTEGILDGTLIEILVLSVLPRDILAVRQNNCDAFASIVSCHDRWRRRDLRSPFQQWPPSPSCPSLLKVWPSCAYFSWAAQGMSSVDYKNLSWKSLPCCHNCELCGFRLRQCQQHLTPRYHGVDVANLLESTDADANIEQPVLLIVSQNCNPELQSSGRSFPIGKAMHQRDCPSGPDEATYTATSLSGRRPPFLRAPSKTLGPCSRIALHASSPLEHTNCQVLGRARWRAAIRNPHSKDVLISV